MTEFSVGDEVKVNGSPYEEINGSVGLVSYISDVDGHYQVVFKGNSRRYSLSWRWLESLTPKPSKPSLSDLPVCSVIQGAHGTGFLAIRFKNGWVEVDSFSEKPVYDVVQPRFYDEYADKWVIRYRPENGDGYGVE